MTLTNARRTSIYQKLLPYLGEEDAEAFMSEFPASEHDQLVTRDHLRAEIGLIRTEMADFRTEIHDEFGLVRTEMAGIRSDVTLLAARQDTFATKQDLQELRVEMHGLVNRHLITMAGAIIAGMGLAASIT